MSSTKRLAALGTTVTFEKFWTWLLGHSNCILRAGTPEVALFDQDDFHWSLLSEDGQTLIVQLVRGKEPVGELLVFPSEISYVQAEPGEGEGEWLFECVNENENTREVSYHFLMAHEYEADAEKWTH